MSKLCNIEELKSDAIENFINSVEVILFDIDGVLILHKIPIPGAIEFLEKVKKLQKKVFFVTNNTIYPKHLIVENLKPFKATEEEILTPNDVLIDYLDIIGFKNDKDIFAITTSLPKKLLRKAGYNVITYEQIQQTPLEQSISGVKNLILKGFEACKNVGLIYLDADLNVAAGNVQLAKALLNHSTQKEDILCLSGMSDELFPIGDEFKGIGAGYYINALEKWTKRTVEPMAKPGKAMADFVKMKHNIKENKKVLMIGDNVSTDITFGVDAGFQTLLVLSGCTAEDEVMPRWSYPERVKPDYVATSLAEVYEKMKNM
ncbi:uncharacterized protein LOC126748271 [Anthonomus grandis grandis]|uniref:uncharacterized protein LOC126748271 n=1 Tax=Anthonomus grandis grandis TaxID=2921223 RepID=UPI002165DA9A|nr:uncharacterized protein LOC126748271 [Anthonomus grandis grandis]